MAGAVGFWLVAVVSRAASALAGDVGTFVDEAKCTECHARAAEAWRGSHHDLAMQEASPGRVLGDFSGTSFSYGGVTTRFSRDDDKYVVDTDGPDGSMARFDVRYVFGVTPLQQYLLPLPAGRLQALSVAWDVEKKRWYHLYPGENVDFRDELHWTKPSQNWNFMCAECHSTDLEKSYDEASDSYDTRWFRIDVGCQACHGPGAEHVEWAEAHRDAKPGEATAAEVGLTVDLAAADSSVQIEACARCHSRRSVIVPQYRHGKRLMDTHLPALLDEDLYYDDGQIREEVYEYGSFLQSKMAQKGLRCSDCHDAHSGRLKAQGDTLCVSCHNPGGPAARAEIDSSSLVRKVYDSPEHHFHKAGEAGSHCIECHAPKTAYMGIDLRADHSFRIPRPDLTESIGTPNACNGCHSDKTPRWAADAIREHAPPSYRPAAHYGSALHAGRRGRAGALQGLAGVAGNAAVPAIVRATVLGEMVRYPGRSTFLALAAGLSDTSPLVRRQAVSGLSGLPPPERARVLSPLLDDPVLAVRIEAAVVLAPLGEAAIAEKWRGAFRSALAELEASHRANADRVEGRIGRGNLLAALGRNEEAEKAYRSALALEPSAVPAAANLADLYRARGKEAEAEAVLREALTRVPGNPALEQALALSLVRQGKKEDALALLASAATSAPDRPDIVYTYAVALADLGKRDEAISILEKRLAASRGSRDFFLALAAFHRDRGDAAAAAAYLEELAAVNPEDPAISR